MALSEGQFKDLEKRLLAFKAQFGITHTAQGLISAEKFGKSYNQLTIETVKAFYNDAKSANFKI